MSRTGRSSSCWKRCIEGLSESHESPNDLSNRRSDREFWTGKLDFVLSCIGYGVGIGDLIRFPYIFIKNGGGAFLIPFFLFLVLCGFPLFYLEVCLGQFSNQSCTSAWKIAPLFRGIGWAMLSISSILSIYYIMMIVWTMNYLFNSFQSTVPWSTCNNTWNTPWCVIDYSYKAAIQGQNYTNQNDTGLMGSNITLLNMSLPGKPVTAAEEYWERKILGLSSGIDDLGGIQWQLALCLLLTWAIVFLCLLRGIKTSGRVVYVTVLLPYVLLTVFLIQGATLPGARDGIEYFLNPKWHMLLKVQVWVDAAVQVFFSLGPAWGGLITMASYNRFNHNCFRDSIITTIADGATGLYGGLVISCVLGHMAYEANVHVSEVVASGPGLALVAYPEAISKLPVPQIWAFLFFITLIMLGLDSQFGMFESVSSGLVDEFPQYFKGRKLYLTAAMTVVAFLLGLPFTTQGGMYLYHIVDSYAGTYAVLFIAFLECVIVGWIYGAGNFSIDVKLMLKKAPSLFMRICWTVVTPSLLFAMIVFLMTNHTPPTYGNYEYPQWSIVFGISLSTAALIPIPGFAIHEMYLARGSIWLRIKKLLERDSLWGPNNNTDRLHYDKSLRERKNLTFFNARFGWNLDLEDDVETLELKSSSRDNSDFKNLEPEKMNGEKGLDDSSPILSELNV